MKMRLPRKLAAAIIIVGFMLEAPTQAQTFSVLYNFGTNSGDPCNPTESGIVAQGRDGNLYTTAPWCGANGYGAVFKITLSGTLTVLHSFDATTGLNPRGGLTLGTDGNFYGTTAYGGTYGYGTIFKVTSAGELTVLYNFTNGSDGGVPFAPPVQGADGNFYGTTCQCDGDNGPGTVYKITPSGTFTLLYQFGFPIQYPYAPLVQGRDGSFYGTVSTSGTGGIIFKITPTGNFTTLYEFTDGSSPIGPLIQGNDGNFYGTTLAGGIGNGTVFKLTAAGGFTVLHSMNGSTDGYNPYAGLAQGSDGNFYGVNAGGGSILNCQGFGCGTVFKINSKGSYSLLHNFDYKTGAYPSVTLLQHTNGIFYGDTWAGGISSAACTQSSGCAVFYSWNSRLPAFVNLLPDSGKVGKTIEFLGQGFKGTKSVSFNGTAASFKVISNTYLTAVVPKGATTGFVTVTTPKRKLTSNKKFQVL
jgi:uncharacterized repeat protein (TIGR03803 family)